ncbi:MAG TPA: hypothetical protein VKT21_06075 [Thermoplasmata archaeon]|nr:hypothetical protein [Thermoplasmata archaeon]
MRRFVGMGTVRRVGAFSHPVGIQFYLGRTVPEPDHLLEGNG